MKHIRFSPWLILVLAVVLVFAAGCDRPDPQVAIDTPQPMNVPQQPVGPQGETPAPGGESNAPDGAATPTLPAVVVATSESVTEGTPVPGGQEVPQISPTCAAATSAAANTAGPAHRSGQRARQHHSHGEGR